MYLRFFDYDEAFNYYCDLISKMRQNRQRKDKPSTIAKPVLILSIIRLIEEGKNVNRFEYDELESIYKNIFGYFFIEAHQENFTRMCYPFYHLKTDMFWHLIWTNAETEIDSVTAAWLRRNVKYACIDKELWVLLSHKTYRDKLKEYIIEEKIKNAFGSKNNVLLKAILQLLMVV